MSIAIEVKLATKDDLTEIIKLYQQSDMDNGMAVSIEDAEKIFNKTKLYPNYNFYVAINTLTDKRNIIGVFGLLIMDNLGHRGTPSAIIEGVCVHEKMHGLGIGKQMMMAAKKTCEEAGCYKMALTSNITRQNAHQFYKSLGFEQHGISFQLDY
jgi:GNAT superfamily N-acetyltransferase